MLSSGGLGIMQKIQQNSPYADEKASFVLIAFALASISSYGVSILAKKDTSVISHKMHTSAFSTGLCFGCCNLLNTTLAGRLNSAVFFPLQNISVILLSLLFSIIIFREKPTRKDIYVLLLGGISIFLLNI
jgi:drug/metabolite transporter (DMT)-like permease